MIPPNGSSVPAQTPASRITLTFSFLRVKEMFRKRLNCSENANTLRKEVQNERDLVCDEDRDRGCENFLLAFFSFSLESAKFSGRLLLFCLVLGIAIIADSEEEKEKVDSLPLVDAKCVKFFL